MSFKVANVFYLLYCFQSFSDLLKTNLTIWMFDHPFYHGFKTDPRKDVRELYNSPQKITYGFDRYLEATKTDQVHVSDKKTHDSQMRVEILNGRPQKRRILDDFLSVMTCGHHLRINDVLTESVNTILAWTMDSGITAKIFSKHYLSDSKLRYF